MQPSPIGSKLVCPETCEIKPEAAELAFNREEFSFVSELSFDLCVILGKTECSPHQLQVCPF